MRLRSIFWELVESFKNCEDVDPFADANSVDFLVSSTWVPREERFKSATLGKCLQAAAWKKLIPKKISKKHPKNYQQILFPRNWSTKLQLFLESAWGCRTPLGASKGAVEAEQRAQSGAGNPFLEVRFWRNTQDATVHQFPMVLGTFIFGKPPRWWTLLDT